MSTSPPRKMSSFNRVNACVDEGVPSGDHFGASADHALFSQPTPALPTCYASQFSEPTTYQETMHSPYHAIWSHAMEREIAGYEDAGFLASKGRERGLSQVGVHVEFI